MYEDVLRSVRYRLAKGSARFERRFRLSCSEMNGRYTSNELTLEVKRIAGLQWIGALALSRDLDCFCFMFFSSVSLASFTQVNFLHSLDSLYQPSHLLASQQQFLHPSHHAGELSGHTLPNPHRNSGDMPLSCQEPMLTFPVVFILSACLSILTVKVKVNINLMEEV